ncbi:hypothetical protein [Tranquillimonas alkanivorans]|uniref:Lipoprotein n=1 Tax=Tranquillimonas alkanivorans TaxID=441119 RepID=A0A1I5RP79_9RHOB|nr:hypothetical protein [Tranquillimonas alkanivorans]SFP60293.1 hypothetical protein SAMN04488047_10918 [Tranquillimonas alkanivorans]
MRIGIVLTACTLLGGCAAYDGYYREGAPVAQLDADLLECRVSAVQRVPPNTQIRTTPISRTPVVTRCNDDGTCVTTGGEVTGGNTYSYDANAGLRTRVLNQCMAARGYRRVELPYCAGDAPPLVPARLPALTPATCAVRTAGGGVAFVNDGG